MGRDRILQIFGSVHDVVIAAIAFYGAYATYYGYMIVNRVPGLHDKAILFMAVASACFFAFSLNRGSWRYASIPELLAIIKASAAAVIAFTVLLFLLSRGDNLPRAVPLLTFIFLITGLSGPRLIYRLVKEQGYFLFLTNGPPPTGPMRDVVLFGYSENADSFIRAVRRSGNSNIRIHGIIDDKAQIGQSIQGVGVIARRQTLPPMVESLKQRGIDIDELVVTDFDMSTAEIGDLISLANAAGLKVSRIPNLADTSSVDAGNIEPNPIKITDLLGRDEVHVDTRVTRELIKDRTVMITGAGGSIGSELTRQIASYSPSKLVLLDISELLLYNIDADIKEKHPELDVIPKIADVRDRLRIQQLFSRYEPDVVMHAAALKHVPLMEDNIVESMKTNILGARNLADCSVEHGIDTFVMISSDKAVNPSNIMGATKRAAEAYCQALDLTKPVTRFRTVRFGNVLGSSGSVVPKFEKQIAKGGPVTVTHPDMVRYFMTIPEAVRLVLQAAGHEDETSEERGHILVLEMGNRVRIADLAIKMIELAGYKPHIEIPIEYTELRPGEKLYEELFDSEEEVKIIRKQGYMVAASRPIKKAAIEESISQMEMAIIDGDQEAALKALQIIVPEYLAPKITAPSNILSIDDAKRKRA